jgi:hypothetical protein
MEIKIYNEQKYWIIYIPVALISFVNHIVLLYVTLLMSHISEGVCVAIACVFLEIVLVLLFFYLYIFFMFIFLEDVTGLRTWVLFECYIIFRTFDTLFLYVNFEKLVCQVSKFERIGYPKRFFKWRIRLNILIFINRPCARQFYSIHFQRTFINVIILLGYHWHCDICSKAIHSSHYSWSYDWCNLLHVIVIVFYVLVFTDLHLINNL